MGWKAVQNAASAILLGVLVLAGCGGGGGGASTTTPQSTVTVTLKSIEVTPSIAQAAAGTLTQFKATGIYSDTSKQDLTTQVTWASSDSAIATVSNAAGSNGLATTAGVGSTTVSATSATVTGSTTLTVTDATLVSIEVTPATPASPRARRSSSRRRGPTATASTQDLTSR